MNCPTNSPDWNVELTKNPSKSVSAPNPAEGNILIKMGWRQDGVLKIAGASTAINQIAITRKTRAGSERDIAAAGAAAHLAV